MEADTSAAQVEEHKAKAKTLEQENLAKEQEITSLAHRNQLLEAEVEKIDEEKKKYKRELEEAGAQGTQVEALQRRLQILEEEAEESDRNLRETNEKSALIFQWNGNLR